MDVPSVQELKLRLSELENHRDATLLYSPKDEDEKVTQMKNLKILSDEINTLKKVIASGGLHRVN